MHNNRLDSYLDVLEKAQSSFPIAARREWRAEARQHLLDLAGAHEQLGLLPEDAIEAAFLKFGNAEQIGLQMARSPVITPLEGKTAVTLFSVPMIVAMVLMIVLAYAYVSFDNRAFFTALQIGGVSAFCAIPALGGWLVGKRFPRRQSNRAVFRALALAGIGYAPIASVLLIPAIGSPYHGATPDLRWGLLWFPITWLSLCAARRKRTQIYPLS